MEFNKEIFFTFLESSDWTNEKTYNLFQRANSENVAKIKKLEDDVLYFQNKFDEVKVMLDDTLKKYEDSLKLCEKLKQKKQTKTISTQTFIHNIKQTSVDYEICNKQKLMICSADSPDTVDSKTISKLQLDILWDDVKDILDDNRTYKEKNKDLIVLFCDYKKELVKLMGKNWYKKCVKCVEDFAKISEQEQKNLFLTMIKLFREVFDNDW